MYVLTLPFFLYDWILLSLFNVITTHICIQSVQFGHLHIMCFALHNIIIEYICIWPVQLGHMKVMRFFIMQCN